MLSRAGNRARVLSARRNALGIRFSSTQAQGQKPVSPHVGFYKTFARPIAKVLLMATFTYQLAYWAWVKLEKDEVKRNRTEIEVLEKQLGDMTKGKETKP